VKKIVYKGRLYVEAAEKAAMLKWEHGSHHDKVWGKEKEEHYVSQTLVSLASKGLGKTKYRFHIFNTFKNDKPYYVFKEKASLGSDFQEMNLRFGLPEEEFESIAGAKAYCEEKAKEQKLAPKDEIEKYLTAVSYTHLTLPTIYSV